MDRVLGLSMTPEEVRWVLVDGVTGDGVTLGQGVLDIPATLDPDALITALPDSDDLFAVSLSWSPGTEAAATQLCAALTAVEHGVSVTGVQATEALARGIAERAGYDFLVVCTVEPTETVVATINGQRVTAEQVPDVVAAVRTVRPSPDAIFVLGSGDTESVASTLRDVLTAPVLTAADGQLARARGAVLAAAAAGVFPMPAPVVARLPAPSTKAVSAVLAAAAVTFVVSLSLALVPHRVQDTPPPVHHSMAAGPVLPPAPKVVPQQAPQPPAELQQLYGPPGATPQPRLRDRIIDKIPLLPRFH